MQLYNACIDIFVTKKKKTDYGKRTLIVIIPSQALQGRIRSGNPRHAGDHIIDSNRRAIQQDSGFSCDAGGRQDLGLRLWYYICYFQSIKFLRNSEC